jgi:hypothetical protein
MGIDLGDTVRIASNMSHLAPIYAVWGDNAAAMASDIGEPAVKVRQWRNRGNIPSTYWPAIIAAAGALGRELHWKQFISPADNDQRTHDATSAIDDCPVPACGWALSEAELAAIPDVGATNGNRVIICDVCEMRVDGETPPACTFVDCPHSQRNAA